MNELHIADIFVLALYLVGIAVPGTLMARKVRTLADYFMPRRFGKVMMTTFAFGTGTASDQAVSVAAETFRSGLSGIWWQWLWLPVTPFYWLLAPIMRRFRAITTADVYSLRYDQSVASLFAVVGVIGLSVKIGLLLKGSSVVIDSATGGLVPTNWAIAFTTVLFVLYGTAGGLGAAIVTDFVQGILTVVFSFLLLPFVLSAVGGIQGMHDTIRDPEMFSLVVPGEIGVFFVIMYSIQALVGIVAQPFILGVCSAGRTEMDGRVGIVAGNLLKRVCTIAWSITALAAVAWYIKRGVDLNQISPDHIYGDIARTFLPTAMPGLLGVFIASLLASVMSSCSVMMVSSSALITENIYKRLFSKRSDRHYLIVGRLTCILVVTGGIVFAYSVPDVVTALDIWFRIAPMMGAAFWLGLFWRRATPAGAWAVTLTGFLCWYLVKQKFFITYIAGLPFSEQLNLVWQTTDQTMKIYEPWSILFCLASAVFGGIVVSFCSRPIPDDRLDRFYALIRTPVLVGEEVGQPCTLPKGVHVSSRRMLLRRFGLEVPMPSRVSLIGFTVSWLAVAALVLGFLLLVQR